MARSTACSGSLPALTLFLSGALALCVLLSAVLAAATTKPEEFLVNFGRRAAAELNDSALNQAQREQRFRELLNEAVDIKTISRFILGRYWRSASAEDRAGFLEVFEELAMRRILPMFKRRSEQRRAKSFDVVNIRRPKERPDHVFVYTEVVRRNGAKASLVWRLAEKKQGFQIIDITVEGVSLALTLRQEYGSAVQRLGSVGALVEQLREKLQRSAEAPQIDGAVK